jgi:hydroxyacylglutathione hydrolase
VNIPLEDNFEDVLGKAMRGLGLTASTAADRAGLSLPAVDRLLAGQFDEPHARALAAVLQLSPEALVRLGRGAYQPQVTCPPNLATITTRHGSMLVNAYVLWDPQTRAAAVFDTGTDASPLLETVRTHELNVVSIFLTHSHRDHIGALRELRHELAAEAWSSEGEPVPDTKTFRPGDLFNAGHHFIRTRLTPGHSPGGTTFVIEGATVHAAMVGDALFAGSVGGIPDHYPSTLETIRREILGLPDETILCPGHGPLTTVAQEKACNPFFA